MFNKGDKVIVKGYEGEVIKSIGNDVLVHFGRDVCKRISWQL